MTNRQIAEQLGCSEKNIEKRISTYNKSYPTNPTLQESGVLPTNPTNLSVSDSHGCHFGNSHRETLPSAQPCAGGGKFDLSLLRQIGGQTQAFTVVVMGAAQTLRPASGRARLAARVRASAAVLQNRPHRRNPPPMPVQPPACGRRRPTRGYVRASIPYFTETEEAGDRWSPALYQPIRHNRERTPPYKHSFLRNRPFVEKIPIFDPLKKF